MRIRHKYSVVKLMLLLLSVFHVTCVSFAQEQFSPHEFVIHVSCMEPKRWSSRTLDFGYNLSLQNDSVTVRLPYMGVAYRARVEETLPQFSAPVSDFTVRQRRKGRVEVRFRTFHTDACYTFRIIACPDGSAGVYLSPSHAESISYQGTWENPNSLNSSRK